MLDEVLLLIVPFFNMLRLMTGIVPYCCEVGGCCKVVFLSSSIILILLLFLLTGELPTVRLLLRARLIGSILKVGTAS